MPAWCARALLILAVPAGVANAAAGADAYVVADTWQDACHDAGDVISPPGPGEAFAGQDAQYVGNEPAYTLSGDGLTVDDNTTGLTWQQSPDTDGDGDIDSADKKPWSDLPAYVAALNAASFGGYDDWRVPTIKELYSLIDFRGTDPSGYQGSDTSGIVPFVDTAFFAFGFGDIAASERLIDAQYWSSTEYVSTTMGGDPTVFGVNFADGRIKGYPRDTGPGGTPFTQYIRCVRGNMDYGINEFVDNGNGTVTDHATGLMWQQADSGAGMNWEDALAYADNLALAGCRDWRLPNAKELQSIVDYARSPDTSASAAIDPVFQCSVIANEAGAIDYPCYWSGTTHANWTATPGAAAAYVVFGRGMGYMHGSWIDMHGAGCQRSDPKDGDPADFPFGRGPQGDAIRIFNYVRCVRAAATAPTTDTDGDSLTDWYEWDCAANPTNMVATVDTDGDGASNEDEAGAGTVPTDPASFLRITGFAAAASGAEISWASELGKSYSLQRSADVVTDPFATTVLSGISATPPVNAETDLPIHSTAYYRVAVE